MVLFPGQLWEELQINLSEELKNLRNVSNLKKALEGPNFHWLEIQKLSLQCSIVLDFPINTVNQLNLTAVKISFLKVRTYLVQENLAFWQKAKNK